MDAEGNEVTRNEGFLPKVEFRAWMEMSLARVAFVQKKWDAAEQRYDRVVRERAETSVAPEAVYWRGVCRYKKGDQAALGETQAALAQKYPGSLWARKSSVWAR
jgi:TolA-binding protein